MAQLYIRLVNYRTLYIGNVNFATNLMHLWKIPLV